MQRYTVVRTREGWVAVGGCDEGLRFTTLPYPTRSDLMASLGDLASGLVEDDGAYGDLARRLRKYFNGERMEFPDKIDFAGATEFDRLCWSAARSIPYGEVRTYSWLAKQVGKSNAWRAAGNAMARNRLPVIVPCHRVVASDGGLGGFSGGLGVKKLLLRLDAGGASA